MDKIYSILLLFIILLTVGCTVNDNTGAITVTNYTTEEAKNIRVGPVYIGTIYPGKSRTFYFFAERSDAEIICDNFDPDYGLSGVLWGNYYNGTIDLRKNFSYTMSLSYRGADNKYYIDISGEKYGIDENNRSSADTVTKE